jgi:HEAT repeat protein
VLEAQQQRQLSLRTALVRSFAADEATLRTALTSRSTEGRFAAAYVVGERQLAWQPDLIARLTDPNDYVRQAARRSLVILSFFALREGAEANEEAGDSPTAGKGIKTDKVVDFGPKPGADQEAQRAAAKKWEDWWDTHRPDGKVPVKPELRAVESEADLDASAARLSAALVFTEPSRQAAKLAQYRDAKGIVYTEALANALPQLEGAMQRSARESLADRLTRMTAATLRSRLDDPRPELRRAAALAWAMKDDRAAIPELIALLEDPEDLVVRAARAGLKSLTQQDFGPTSGATRAERTRAVADWKAWWEKQPRGR